MEVHAPHNLDLPPLRINQRNERVMIEESQEVEVLIKTKLLLEPTFNLVLMSLRRKTKKLLELVDLATKAKYDPFGRWVVAQSQEPSLSDFVTRTVSFTNFVLDESSVFLTDWEKNFEKRAIEARAEVRKQIIALSDDMNELSSFEGSSRLNAPILSTTALYICPKCNRIVSVASFCPLECQCGADMSTVSNVLQVAIKHFSDKVVKFLDANNWLEHGVAHLLRQKNISALVGVEVLGHSGMWHEIDVIGESRQQNYRIFCECKNSDLKAAHVFVFFGKMNDVGCTRGYMFTTSKEVPLQIVRLARSKNIGIIADVLQRPNSELLDELKDI